MENVKKRWASRRGISTVEAALVLPVVLAVLLGTVEYSWLLYVQHSITSAARQGGRIGARADSTAADVETAVTNAIAATSVNQTVTSAITTLSGAGFDELEAMEQFTVTVEVESYDSLFGIIPVPSSLSSSVVFLKEGS